MFIQQLPLWLAQTNCWIVSAIEELRECVLIDVPPSPNDILATLKESGLKPVAILATHGHIDHVGGIGTLSRATWTDQNPLNLPVYLNHHDNHMIQDPVGTAGLLGGELAKLGINVKAPELLFDLEDGDQVSGAGMTFKAIHTPGHTEGSVCFQLTIEGLKPILFTGDHLFKGSIGRTDLPGGSYEKLVSSMRDKILPLPDEMIVLPGHGEPTTLGEERKTNPFLVQMAL